MSDEGLGVESSLETSLRNLLDRRRAQSTLRNLTISSPSSIDFSSNDFLSLSRSPQLRSELLKELSNPNLRLGSGGSRLLDGNSKYAEDLERDIAGFHRAPAGLLFNSGFDANAGFFACVPQPGDIIVYDELIHASVHDGMRLSRAARKVPFKHNDVMNLKEVLHDCLKSDKRIRAGLCNIFIAIEAIYSMDGDLAPLKAIVELVERTLPRRNGHVIIDEAHSTGVIGEHGRGLVCDLGLEGRVFARLHTFGKALACNGAIILCSPTVRHYLINYARPLIYTTFMSYPALAAIRASYTFLQQGHTVPLALQLQNLTKDMFDQLQALVVKCGQKDPSKAFNLIRLSGECPQSPIFSILTPSPRSLAKYCQEGGFIVRAVVPPTVPEGTSRIRVCLHAGNTLDEIRNLIRKIEEWVSYELDRESVALGCAVKSMDVKARL